MTRGVRLLVIGKQGSGKGTLCDALERSFGAAHISTGAAFRAAIATGTDVGRRASSFLAAGSLVPDEIVMDVVEELFRAEELAARGFIFDGFPRTLPQADLLDAMLEPEGVDAVIDLDVATDIVVARLSSRRVCVNPECGAIYSLAAPPRVPWVCDRCGSEVTQRDDDREDAIVRRLADYEEMTEPLLRRYDAAGSLVTVNAAAPPDAVVAEALEALAARSVVPRGPASGSGEEHA